MSKCQFDDEAEQHQHHIPCSIYAYGLTDAEAMRQATLPWAPPPHAVETHHPFSSHPSEQQPSHVNHTALDPALFATSQQGMHGPNEVIDVDIPETHSQLEKETAASADSLPIDMSSASSSPSPSSPTTVPTIQQTVSSSIVATEPAQNSSEASTAAAAARVKPALHPFFKSGGTSTTSSGSLDDSETEHKRPPRSSRTKAPVSYREDLKAVLRADMAQEAARLKQEKKHAQLESTAAKKAQRSSKAKGIGSNGKDKENDGEGFEIVETRVNPSPTKPKPVAKVIPEPRQLSLTVKGTGSAANANPHPFFVKKVRPPPAQPTLPSNHISATVQDGSEAPKQLAQSSAEVSAPASTAGTHATDKAPAAWSLFSTPRISSSKPRKPVHALWPTCDDTHVVGLQEAESDLIARSRDELPAFHVRWHSQSQPRASSPRLADDRPPADDFVPKMNRDRHRPSLGGVLVNGTAHTFDSIEDYTAQSIDVSSLGALSSSRSVEIGNSCRSSGQLWCDAWRPRTASSCLGNEPNASFLLEWLRRLLVAAPGAVQTRDKKRRHGIQRKVDKQRRKKRRRGYSDDEDSDDMADFIVDDDEDEDAPGEHDETISDEQWFGRFAKIERTSSHNAEGEDAAPASAASAAAIAPPAPKAPASIQPQQQQNFAALDRLTNCIVLTGPSGSGKTASVYACAAELGYEVFELFPGMGRRTGKDLLLAVGDLGRNHMVSSGGVGGGATFKKSSQSTSNPTCNGAAGSVRQSLILIEEADLLFDDDKGFWPAVIELVSESKRPVVITCNDTELVPLPDLPVQEVLEFRKPTLGETVPYLQMLAAGAGRYIEADRVEEMLLELPSTKQPLHEDEEEEDEGVDLRQAVNQLQFGHIASTSSGADVSADAVKVLAEARADMKAVASAAESSSLSDMFEHRSAARHAIEAWGESGVDQQSSSRQLGSWTQLVPQPLALLHSSQVAVQRNDLEYRSTFAAIHLRLASAAPAHTSLEPVRLGTETLSRRQAREERGLRRLLRPLYVHRLSYSAHLPEAMRVEYGALARLMALVDEDLYAIHRSLHQQTVAEGDEEGGAMRGRKTRNSTRLTAWLSGQPYAPEYQRWLPLGPEEVRAARATALHFDAAGLSNAMED